MQSKPDTQNVAHAPVAKAEMLIRKPVAQVFEAFVDPAITSKFWFTRGSARLRAGQKVRWDWDMYQFYIDVVVLDLEPNNRLRIQWFVQDHSSIVEWKFTPSPGDNTFVSITVTGFQGDAQTLSTQAINATEGFAFVLAGAKAYLEHGIQLNLVADRFPDDVVS